MGAVSTNADTNATATGPTMSAQNYYNSYNCAGRFGAGITLGEPIGSSVNYDNQVGICRPAGVSYTFDNFPVDVFAELAPPLDIAPFVRGEITGGIRHWF